MESLTILSGKGQVVIPADVRRRLKLRPGARLVVTEHGGEITLRPLPGKSPFPVTTTADLDKLPRWPDKAKTIDEISRLSDEAVRQAVADQETNARA
jgi:AbrB family looped-hinge helix DNA binding protein